MYNISSEGRRDGVEARHKAGFEAESEVVIHRRPVHGQKIGDDSRARLGL